jgi:hypothetical protein
MGIRSKLLFRHAMIGAVALVAAAGWLGASPAHSQSHSGAALPPNEIERMLGERGYRLTGPVVRHGKVYFANVLGQQDDVEQLVVDARDGRLLRQSPGGPPIRRPDESSPLGGFFGALFGPPEDAAPLSPPPASDFYENPKPKAQVKRSRPESKPVVQPASVPGDAKTPSSNPDAATPGVTTPGAATPGATTPAAATPSVAPPAAASAKAAPATPETATAAPGAASSKTSTQKLNDVPVAPLE